MACILIIDDEADLRATMRAALEQDGHEVFEAKNGTGGLALLDKIPVELVITDILMPEKDGLETIVALHRDRPDIRIIAISGGGNDGGTRFLSIAEKFGASRILAKPFRRQQLQDAVRAALDTVTGD
jgi:DNA-binding NtrC family response regulator